MDYRQFVAAHEGAAADISLAVKPVTREEAPELGILKIDSAGRIVHFHEKPKTPEALDEMKVDTTVLGLSKEEAAQRPYLASLGIYLFGSRTLERALAEDPSRVDFGKHIIPRALKNLRVQAYMFDGYWADIGTVGAFYDANVELVHPLPRFNLFDPEMPIYTHARFLPGAKVTRASVEGSILCDGVIVEGGMVRDSILGVRARVRPGATIERTIVMGADFYQPDAHPGDGAPFLGIDEGCYIKRAIIDKNASIGRGVQLVNRGALQQYDDPEGRFHVRDGVICVPKGAVIGDGFLF
jgi:glucose-1-phosphate adenylyltransferase